MPRTKLRESRAGIEPEPRLRDLYDRADDLLAQIAAPDRRGAGRGQDRRRYREFFRERDQALFHETQFTGLDLPASREAIRRSARAALAVFAAPGRAIPGRWGRCRPPCPAASERRSRRAATSCS